MATKMNRWMIAFGLTCAAAVGGAAATAAPMPSYSGPSKKTKEPASPAAAVAGEILAEYQSVMAEKKGEGLRTKADYLTEKKAPGLTAENIVAELERQQSTNPRADAYVKWQLLGGIDGAFPDGLRARALKAYRNAPLPPENPGIKHEYLQKALARMGATNPDLETKINEEMIGAKEKYNKEVAPFVAYRDEFYARFTPSMDFFQAVFADIYARVSKGVSGDELWKKVNPIIRQWALKQNPSAKEMAQVSADLAQLRKLVSDGKFKPYYRVMWLKEGDKSMLKWQGDGVIGDLDVMEQIGDWLNERAKGATPANAAAATGSDEKMKK